MIYTYYWFYLLLDYWIIGECRQILEGYTNEIFSCAFNYDGDTIKKNKKI